MFGKDHSQDPMLMGVIPRAAAAIFEHCHELFDCVERMGRALESARSIVAGPLRVGAMEVFSVYLLPVALCQVVDQHPDVTPHSFELLPQAMGRCWHAPLS